jgi:hypothetical protein
VDLMDLSLDHLHLFGATGVHPHPSNLIPPEPVHPPSTTCVQPVSSPSAWSRSLAWRTAVACNCSSTFQIPSYLLFKAIFSGHPSGIPHHSSDPTGEAYLNHETTSPWSGGEGPACSATLWLWLRLLILLFKTQLPQPQEMCS